MFFSRSCSVCALFLMTGCFGSLRYYGEREAPADALVNDTAEESGSPRSGDTGTPQTSDDETEETDTGTPVVEQAPVLTGVEPGFGSNAGGLSVTLSGSDLAAVTGVTFGGAPATILSTAPGSLEAVTPALTGTGPVPVVATNAGGSHTLADGFTYFADASASAGTVGAIERIHEVGGYWEGGVADQAFGSFAFVQGPSDWEVRHNFADPATPGAACAYEYAGQASPTFATTGAASLSFSGTSSFTLPLDADNGGYAGELDEADVPGGAVLDLDPVVGDPGWPSFGISGAVTIPGDFEVTSPDMTGATPPDVLRSHTLEWTGSGGDYMLLFMLRQYENTFTGEFVNDGWMTCAFPDTGSFTVPGGLWPDWFVGDFLHIQLGRVILSPTDLPHTNAEHRVAGVHWVYGGADTF